MRFSSIRHLSFILMAAAMLALPVLAQDAPANESDAGPALKDSPKSGDNAQKPHPLTDEERKERLRSFKKEVGKAYQSWLNEDVRYIITPEEEQAFKALGTDEERDTFIEDFWARRDPAPKTDENEFREEHYRRLAYANEHFSAGIPGWRTDRGHMYISWGAPDEIESHPSGGTYQRPGNQGGGSTSTYPFETWRYRHLEGIGDDVTIEFVDACMCNDYHIATDSNEKDALLHTPGGGATQMEQMGMGSRATRMSGIPGDPNGTQHGNHQFDALERMSKLNAPPPVQFKDLEEKVNTRIRYNLMPFDVRTDIVKLTSDTVLVPITIQIKASDMTFIQKEGIQRASVNIFGRISNLAGRIITTFEDTVAVDTPGDLLPKIMQSSQMYWKTVPLKPGMYKIDLALKDVNGDRVGTLVRSLRVPEFDEEKLASSSLILADLMERVPVKNIGAGSFVLGDTRIRPRPEPSNGKPATFDQKQRLNIWLQIYNLKPDPQSHKPHATITYDIVNMQSGKSILHVDEASTTYATTGDQITIEKGMALANVDPGIYNLKITISDEVTKQSITPTARFQVE